MIKNHYGIMVDSETPITGVASYHDAEWLYEEIANGIDLDFEEHCRECPNEDHDSCYYDDCPTYLIGQWVKENGLYMPDETGEYSAIARQYVQIVYSKHTRCCALCSPCYPGQGDLSTPGEYLAYDLPAEVYGEMEG